MGIKLPLGIDGFRKLRTNNCYYIDKTGFIEELLEETFAVNLITRPRRFGKTLTMSMLSEFFDIRKDSRSIFEGLAITACTDLCRKWMNQWPVLFLTLKDINGCTFEEACDLLQFTISSLCMEHDYLENSEKVKIADKRSFSRLLNRKGSVSDIKTALVVLTRMMEAHYEKPVILLIDEYDVPLAKASDNGYYDPMLNIMRSFLGMAWKTNPSLQFAVITGCLRIAKESIFTEQTILYPDPYPIYGIINILVFPSRKLHICCNTWNRKRCLTDPEYSPISKAGMMVISLAAEKSTVPGMLSTMSICCKRIQTHLLPVTGRTPAITRSSAVLLIGKIYL